MKSLIFISLIFLSACASEPSKTLFQDTQERDRSQQVLDMAKCGVLNGNYDLYLQEYIFACMEKLGYRAGEKL